MAVQKKGVVDMQQVDKEFFVGFVLEKFDELSGLFEEKNKQYGEHDPLANFRTGAKLHGEADYAAMFEEAKAYCRKHIAQVYGQGQNIDTPKVEESLQDIALYSVIMLYMHWAKQKESSLAEEIEGGED